MHPGTGSGICYPEVMGMGYRIEYDTFVGKYEIREKKRTKWPLVMLAVSLLFLLTCGVWTEGAQKLRSFLIPGDDAVTVQAFKSMTEDLRSGASLGDAVYTFCHYVIHGE